jgi:hypothetical protein
MKQLRNISVVGNIILTMLVIWLARRGQPAPPGRLLPIAEVQISNAPSATQLAPSAVPAPKPELFRWSQLESTDYHAYVANLRRVGCPEQTIRDIITADVDTLYAPKRERLADLAVGGSAGRQQMEAQLAELRSEETSLLRNLLGDGSASPALGDKTQPGELARQNTRPVMPLVFANADPASLQLNEAQMEAVNQVRQQFQQEIGVQDPSDPAYHQRWIAAQRRADDTLRGLLGSKVYIQFQVQAANRIPRTLESQ